MAASNEANRFTWVFLMHYSLVVVACAWPVHARLLGDDLRTIVYGAHSA